MKILRKRWQLPQWLTDQTFDCDRCGCVFQIEAQDYHLVRIVKGYEVAYAYVMCPECDVELLRTSDGV